jgi:hypothetical protein
VALVGPAGPITVVVKGTARLSELTAFAASLR